MSEFIRHREDGVILIACLITLSLNVLILGLTLKLYTEYFKNEAQKQR